MKRTRYMQAAEPGRALWHRVCYVDDSLAREEIYTTSLDSDVYGDWKRRVSRDNGRTWSAMETLADYHRQRPEGAIARYPQGTLFDPRRRVRYRGWLTSTWRGLPLYTFDWNTGNHPVSSHVSVSENGTERLLRFEEGPDGDPAVCFDASFCATNQAYNGQSLSLAADGTVFLPIACTQEGRLFTASGLRLMRRDPSSGQWLSSNMVTIPPDWSSVGLQEPDTAILKDGSLLTVCRGLGTAKMPGQKWMSRSRDGGRTISPVEPLCYDDGARLYSPDSIHYFFRSTRNGKLYWIANILAEPPKQSWPRFPLQVAEIDEDKAAVIRASIRLIDDRADGEPDRLQLSNFSFIEDRETMNLEIYVTRLGENPASFWDAPVYKYIFSP